MYVQISIGKRSEKARIVFMNFIDWSRRLLQIDLKCFITSADRRKFSTLSPTLVLSPTFDLPPLIDLRHSTRRTKEHLLQYRVDDDSTPVEPSSGNSSNLVICPICFNTMTPSPERRDLSSPRITRESESLVGCSYGSVGLILFLNIHFTM